MSRGMPFCFPLLLQAASLDHERGLPDKSPEMISRRIMLLLLSSMFNHPLPGGTKIPPPCQNTHILSPHIFPADQPLSHSARARLRKKHVSKPTPFICFPMPGKYLLPCPPLLLLPPVRNSPAQKKHTAPAGRLL